MAPRGMIGPLDSKSSFTHKCFFLERIIYLKVEQKSLSSNLKLMQTQKQKTNIDQNPS